MSIDGNNQPIRGIDPGKAAETRKPDAAQHTDPTTFRRLLEQLEAIGRSDDAAPNGDDLHALQDDLRKADAEFDSVMDLRTRLEDAFRKAQDS